MKTRILTLLSFSLALSACGSSSPYSYDVENKWGYKEMQREATEKRTQALKAENQHQIKQNDTLIQSEIKPQTDVLIPETAPLSTGTSAPVSLHP